MDAGVGSHESLARLITIGYEVSIQPHSHRVAAYPRQHVDAPSAWVRIEGNAELAAWSRSNSKAASIRWTWTLFSPSTSYIGLCSGWPTSRCQPETP